VIDPNFRATLRYQCRGEPATVLADLKELRQRSEHARTMKTAWIVGLVAWAIVCIVTALAAGPLAVVVVLVGLAGAVVLGVLIWRASQMILTERRRKLAVAVVRALACDLPHKGEIDLALHLGDYHDDRFRIGSRNVPSYHSAAVYCQVWLRVTAVLANGLEVALRVDLLAQRKERTKTKGRKKIKEAFSEHVHLTVRVPSLSEQAAQRWPERVRSAALPAGARLHRAVVKKDRLCLELRTDQQVRVTNKGSVVSGADADTRLANRHTLLMPVLAAYHALAASRSST
jgi:hypothetical protein